MKFALLNVGLDEYDNGVGFVDISKIFGPHVMDFSFERYHLTKYSAPSPLADNAILRL